jgi:hypothetical protein
MTQTELGTILQSIDSALEVYRRHQGPLTAREISMKSMFITLRSQVVEELQPTQKFGKLATEQD